MSTVRLTCGPVQLRLPTPRSAQQLYELARDPHLSRYLSWDAHTSLDDARSYIADTKSLWERRVAFLPAIYELQAQRLVGSTGISNIDRPNHRAELGTWIGIPYQGQGFNVPAKSAMLAFAFGVLHLQRVELLVHVENEQSLRAMAKLPGVLDEGVQHRRLFQRSAPTEPVAGCDARMFAITSDTYDPAAWPAVSVEGALA